MSSSEYLVPPSKDPSQEKLWVETWKRIDRFLPDLRKELDLDAPASPEVSLEKEADKEKLEGKSEGDQRAEAVPARPNEEVPAVVAAE
jgi:brefeldin A-resistance guanine nucleotide exchange factor 1